MPASQPAYFHLQEFADVGVPLVGGRLYTYAQGTTAFKAAFTDPAGVVPQTYTADGLGGQYIALNARGELPAALYLGQGSYDITLKRADGSTAWTRRADPTGDGAAALAAAGGTALVSGTWFGGVIAAISALAAAGGAALIGFLQAGAGALSRSIQDKLRERKSVKDFGVVGDGIADDTAAIQKVRDFLLNELAAGRRYRMIWPSGIYSYTVSPNWNIPRLWMENDGEVVLRYKGVGDAFIVNDTDYVGLYNMHVGHFIIEAPSNALNGVHVTSAHHSVFDFAVRGCGTGSAGLLVNFSVCNEYKIIVSNNENGGIQGWYKGANGIEAKPYYGVFLDQRNVNEAATANYFPNPILEGTGYGAWLQNAVGNTFTSGTMEGCPLKGLNLQPGASHNVFYNVDFEANPVHDIYCLGNYNEFHQCQTMNLVAFDGTANGNHMVGGIHQQIALTAATVRNRIRSLIFNRFSTAGYTKIMDTSGRQNIIRDVTCYLDGSTTNGDPDAFGVVVGPTPFTYTNATRQPLLAGWGGGTVSAGSLKRGANQITVGTTQGNVVLMPGDQLILDYTVLPTLSIFPQ